MKRVIVAIVFVLMSDVVWSEPYKSKFGFEYELPDGWILLAPEMKNGVYSNETLQSLGVENIYRIKDSDSLLEQIKSGEVEYLFDKKHSQSDFKTPRFKNSIRIQLIKDVKNSGPLNKVSSCTAIKTELKKKYFSRVKMKHCDLKASNGLKYLEYTYEYPLLGVSTIQSRISLSPHTTMVLQGSSKKFGRDVLRKSQADLVDIIAKHYQALKSVTVEVKKVDKEKSHDMEFGVLAPVANVADIYSENKLKHEKSEDAPENSAQANKRQTPVEVRLSAGSQMAAIADVNSGNEIKHEKGEDTPENSAQAIQHNASVAQELSGLSQMANFGDAEAEYALGIKHEKGEGVPKNHAQAIKHYTSAAAKDHTLATAKLAEAYFTGKIVKKDVEKSILLFKKAANMGAPTAQNRYASLLYQGIKIKKDQAEAKKWFLKAVEQGNEQAQRNLLAIYSAEARSGNNSSKHALAQWYLDGIVVKQNIDRGISLLETAADDGYIPAKKALTRIFTDGLYGRAKNPELALKWDPESNP